MILTGIAAWAHINKPSQEKRGKDAKGKAYVIPARYSVNLMLDGKVATKLKKEGYKIKTFDADVAGIEDSKGKPYLEIKKAAEYQDGNAAKPPACVDAKKKPFTGAIGNGSKIKVSVNPFEWEGFGTTGIAAKLRAVQVIDLVEFGDDGIGEFEEEDGFESSESVDKPVEEGDAESDPWE